jgi:hypothetical protein
MRLPRIVAIVLVAALALGTIGGGFAAASTKKFPTQVTINFTAGNPPYYTADKFKGKVKSAKKLCKKKRKVTVFRKKSGPDVAFGSDKTNKKGKYVVAPGKHAPSGKYYSKAKKKVKHKNGNKIVCKKGKSPTISVP